MTKRALCAVLVLTLYGVGLVHADTPEEAARTAAESWIVLWDANKYGDSYDRLAENTKRDVSRDKWLDYWKAIREPLGAVKSRQLIGAKYFKSLPNLPENEGAMLQYRTSFEKKPSVLETLGMVRQKDGTWRVANYMAQ
jgi:hypothetical protein